MARKRNELGQFTNDGVKQELIQFYIESIKNNADREVAQLEAMEKFKIRLSTAVSMYSRVRKHIHNK